jgi:hypothetical protein
MTLAAPGSQNSDLAAPVPPKFCISETLGAAPVQGDGVTPVSTSW